MATPEQQMAGLARRKERFAARIEWLGERLQSEIRIGMRARVRLAAQLLRDKVVINISRPVHKYRGRRGRIVVDPTSRSKPGEFPKADTTRLMKDIYYEVRGDGLEAIVGTTLDYGLILEVARNRSFLRRSLGEMESVIRSILTQGRGGGTDFISDSGP